MTKDEIIAKVKALELPAGSFVVFGSCPLAAAGLREANDIDMLVSEEAHAMLKAKGWQEIEKGLDDKPLTHDVFDAHTSWNFSAYSPTLEQLLVSADIYSGIPFAALEEVRKWKAASGRPKDSRDIELIDNYLTRAR